MFLNKVQVEDRIGSIVSILGDQAVPARSLYAASFLVYTTTTTPLSLCNIVRTPMSIQLTTLRKERRPTQYAVLKSKSKHCAEFRIAHSKAVE